MGRVGGSRRWEIGLPLLIVGALISGLSVGVRGAGVLFWIGAGLVAVGAGVFFTSPRRS
jgi:hypothetical protein